MCANWTGRRCDERKPTSLNAQAQFYDGSAPLACFVTDLSARGARVEFPEGYEAPDSFDIYIPAIADTRHAVLRWQTPEAVGVEFAAGEAFDDTRWSEVLARLARLEEAMRAARAGALVREARRTADAAQAGTGGDPHEEDDLLGDLPDFATPSEDGVPHLAALSQRIAMLEARNNDILQALKQTLQLLDQIRVPAAAVAA